MSFNHKQITIISILSIFFLFILVYVFFVSKDLIFGIKIKDVNIENGVVAKNPFKLTGNAQNAINLSLNGREISIDQEGNFAETIALLSGYNIINLKAKDKFGYEDEKNYQLIYQK